MLEIGIYQLLAADAGVSALVGNRVFGSRLPAKDIKMPVVIYQVILTMDNYSIQGALNFRCKRFQFDSYSPKYSESVQVSDAVRAVLQSYKGVLPDGTQVHGCIVRQDMDMSWEQGTSGYLYRRLMEVDVLYYE